MNPNENSQNHFLIHRPYGEKHPYDTLPWERTPRDPCESEMVTLGAATSQIPAASAVWCDWQVDGKVKVNRAGAVRSGTSDGMDCWQMVLPQFNRGEKISYRLSAQFGDRLVESEEFKFIVRSWAEAVSIHAIEEQPDQLVVIVDTTHPRLLLRFTVELDAEDTISLRVTALQEQPQRPSQPAGQSSLVKKWGNVELILAGNPLRLSITRISDGMTLRCFQPVQALLGEDNRIFSYTLGFDSPDNEGFYGFGERFNALDQRGNRLDNHVFGQYTNQGKRSYIPVPFFLSSRGYGVWLKTERQAYFDLAASDMSCWKITEQIDDNPSLEMKFFFQPHPREIITAFTDLTGKPQLPPSWVFGLWMSSNDWNNQAEVLHQLRQTQDHGIPASVLVIEAWSDETTYYIWNDATYKRKQPAQAYHFRDYHMPADGLWPDPKGMVDQLHEAGVRLVLWQIPVLKWKNPDEKYDTTQAEADQEYAVKQGFVITKDDGSPHRIEGHAPWFPNSLVPDFSNPDAVDWWFKQREYLVADLGVDGFKTDGGEHIWDAETRFWKRLPGSRGINRYPVMYEAAYNRFMKKHRREDYVLFSRAGYTGVQQVSCHWAGDEKSTWEAYRASIRAMLNAGLCGISFIGWDIAGFSGPIPSSELYLRAAAFSVFCPIMQYHSEYNARQIPSRDRTPWNIEEQTGDKTVVPIFRKFANLRMNLIPYIIGQAHLSHKTGLPMMRALPLEYPLDENCRDYPYEYLFGDGLLVAPVVEEGRSSCPVYLPQGEWYDFWSGEIVQGGREITLDAPLDRVPVFVRRGSVVPLNLDSTLECCSPVGNSTETIDNLTIVVFPGDPKLEEIYQGVTKANLSIFAQIEHNDAVSLKLNQIEKDLDLLIVGEAPHQIYMDGTPMPQFQTDRQDKGSYWSRQTDRWVTRIHLVKHLQNQIGITIQK